MRLSLVSGGVDILRTTEDFLVGMVSTGRRLCPVQIEYFLYRMVSLPGIKFCGCYLVPAGATSQY